jgi:DNA-binding NtrC family response regulator
MHPGLIRAIHEIHPEMAIIVISGDPLAATRMNETDSRTTFLAKPCTFEKLYVAVETATAVTTLHPPIVPLRHRPLKTSSP